MAVPDQLAFTQKLYPKLRYGCYGWIQQKFSNNYWKLCINI